ncbi:YkvA family protein [Phascolarctobacterium sp.]|uniref:YkvA family protein n=1 Tax=Phascolarctobacterium sp. TaxID=2049039 RepID=UPI002A811886|nr:YkvA family protein [Phascolarctobacterium sp.]MDY5044786.1 YkvA family protein [Phascolarctobacterium sp.]
MAEEKQQTEPKFDESQITEKELQKYEQHYNESSFLDKVTKYGKLIGINALYKAVQLWFVMQKPDVPATTKAVIMGALGYLIAPLDFLPDLMPVLGYTDDFVAITFALIKVQGYIDEEVERKSKHLLAKIFGEEAVSKL